MDSLWSASSIPHCQTAAVSTVVKLFIALWGNLFFFLAAEVHMRLNGHVLEFFFSSCPQYELHTCPVQHAYWWIHGYYINAHRIMPETYCAWSCKMEIITVQFSTVRNKTCMAEFHFVIMGNCTKRSCLKTQNRHLKDALGNELHKVR